GVAHYLFVPLAEAVVFAMLASYVLSRTLVPTLVMWFYRNAQHYPAAGGAPGGLSEAISGANPLLRPFRAMQRTFERSFERLREGYRRWLGDVLRHRGAFALLFLLFCLGTMLLVP